MAISLIGSSGVSAAAASGVSVTLTWATAPSAGDVCVVMNVGCRAGNLTVLSGSGAAYTTLLSTVNGNLNANVCYRVAGTGETTASCSGSGNASDGHAAAGFVFRGVNTPPVISISSRATGTSSRPDSPAELVAHSGDAVISAVCALSNSAAAVTAPSGYTNLISTGATDTRSCQLGMSWFASTNAGGSGGIPLSYDPGVYSSFTSAVWMGFTIVVQSTDPYVAFDLENPSILSGNPWMSQEREVVAYGNVLSRSS